MCKIRLALYILLPALVICIITFARYTPSITITQVNTLDNLQLPAALQQRLQPEAHSELMLIRYNADVKSREIQYIYSGYALDRVDAITRLFKKLAVTKRYQLQPGDYLFNLHDGTYEDYGWPVLGFAALKKLVDNQTTVLIPAPEILDRAYNEFFADIDNKIRQYPWDKKIAKIFWRGSLTGSGHDNNNLLGSERLRFLAYANAVDYADVGVTSYTQQHNLKFLQSLVELYPLKKSVTPGAAQAYKYLIDIDGNSCSYSRMAWVLYSNSVLFKHASENVQWYYAQLQAYTHYVPINEDFSNLYEQLQWAEAHPQEAQAIAANSRELAKKIFNQQSILRAAADALNRYHELATK